MGRFPAAHLVYNVLSFMDVQPQQGIMNRRLLVTMLAGLGLADARAETAVWPNGDDICRVRLHNTGKTGDSDATHQCCNDVVLVENEEEDKKQVKACEDRLLGRTPPPAPKETPPEPEPKKRRVRH